MSTAIQRSKNHNADIQACSLDNRHMNKPIKCKVSTEMSALYKQLSPYAISKTRYITGDDASARDIVQDVFEKLWQRELEFPDIKMAYQWVYTSCHNAAIDHLRKDRRKIRIESNLIDVNFVTPLTPQDRLANRQAFESILNHLSERQGLILGYIIIDGLSQKEIASLMKVSEKTIQRDVAAMNQRVESLRGHYHA